MPFDKKPMKFSFSKPDGAKPMPETVAEDSTEVEPMSGEEMGTAVKAAMSSGGDALYQAIAKIVENCQGK